jgi:membrane protein involved in colicin uptake
MLATLIRMIFGFRWSFTHHVATGDTGDYYLSMPYKSREAQREWQRIHREDTPEKKAHRREYERERKNRKRIEQILQLPEPERSRRLEQNAKRRARKLRWSESGS